MTKHLYISIIFDPPGGIKSLQNISQKTAAPLNTHFRKITIGGHHKKWFKPCNYIVCKAFVMPKNTT